MRTKEEYQEALDKIKHNCLIKEDVLSVLREEDFPNEFPTRNNFDLLQELIDNYKEVKNDQ